MADGQPRKLVTLEGLQRIARLLAPLRWLALLGSAFWLAVFALGVTGVIETYNLTGRLGIEIDDHEAYLLPALVFALWLLTVYTFVNLFRTVPEPVDPGQSFSQRFTPRLRRAGYWVLATVVAACGVATLLMTYRLTQL